jgi:hypothetical protein
MGLGSAVGYGVLCWLVPFVVSVFFFTSEGKMHPDVNPAFFKQV